jgi:MFS family permease
MKQTALFTPVLIAGCIIVMLSFAVRASFGVFQIPVAAEFGWLRTEFSMAIALQNLFWGIGQPIFGAIADKVTDRKAIILGGLVYALGLVLSSTAVTSGAMQLYGILVGFGIAGTGFGESFQRPQLFANLSGLFLLRLSACFYYSTFSSFRD